MYSLIRSIINRDMLLTVEIACQQILPTWAIEAEFDDLEKSCEQAMV
jgi:hypothetical protein